LERNLISWNMPNWFTVVLMGAGGYAAIAGVVWLLRQGGIGRAA
jgi:hypothetical protein